MAHQYDRIVQALYLTKSAKREEMLTNLVENILFSYGFSLGFTDIRDLIRDDIGFVPIELELRASLDNGVESGLLVCKDDRFSLTDQSKTRVALDLAFENEIEGKRFENFKSQCPVFLEVSPSNEEIVKLWKAYNEYLIKCFLEFGKKAIEIFLPNSPFNELRANGFLNEALKQLDHDYLKEAFRKIAQEYPDRLNPAEIKYLNSLATRAEKVFSLGLQKEELERIQNLTFKDIVVFADTNFLYQVLGLNDHPEDDAVQQILFLARNKVIDFKLAFLGNTLRELNTAKEELERRIPKQSLNPSQIRALLKSNELDDFARRYYSEKLRDSEIPHPSTRVMHALENLRSKGMDVYRHKFPALDDDEDNKLLNAKVTQYYDWVSQRNEQRQSKGLGDMRYKSEKQVEHDVYLREAMLMLRRKVRGDNEIKYLCLTLDRRLIDFDLHESRQSVAGQFGMVTPLFMTPSVFLSKIRPFLPIQTEDYQKAFVKALTCATADSGDAHRSELLQRSFTYFAKQGIDDEGAIGNIIRQDLFLTDFEAQEAEGEAQAFIESKINGELERTRVAAQEAEALLASIKQKFDESQYQNQQNVEKYQSTVHVKENEIAKKEGHISSLEEKLATMQKQLESQQANGELVQRQNTYYRELPQYQATRWRDFEKEFSKGKRFLIWFSLSHIAPVIFAYFLTQGEGIKTWLVDHNLPKQLIFWLVLFLTIISAAALLIYRTLFIDKPEKELSRLTWRYMWGNKKDIKETKFEEYRIDYEHAHPDLADAIRIKANG